MTEHARVHKTLVKKTITPGKEKENSILQALNMDMIRCTAVRQVPQIYWESSEFENMVKNIVELAKVSEDPIAAIQKITPRKTRARETSKLNDEIEKVNFYQ